MNQILLGDCLEKLKDLPDSSVDSCVTDPPYGLGTREPTGEEIIGYLQGGDLDHGGDFMGREWSIPSVAVWKEVFRVLKPGAHLLCFGGTRTFDLISIGIRAAGFECRDTIASQLGVMCLEWVQGQGFPKSMNVHKALEKMGLNAAEIEQFEGLGTALKPSWEPVLVFRKPIAESTVAKQVLKTGTGALNIDVSRVRTQDKLGGGGQMRVQDGNSFDRPWMHDETKRLEYARSLAEKVAKAEAGGRWPANLVLTHTEQCKRVGSTKVPAPVINRFDDGAKPFGDGAGHEYTSHQTGDADGMEEIPVYECVEGCPVRALDEQSLAAGMHTAGNKNSTTNHIHANEIYGRFAPQKLNPDYHKDQGGASRFFNQFEPLESPFLYSPKVSKAERDRGLPKGTNKHPTVKPQALMRWLVKLVTPKGGTVLDPYCGSGSTGVAAVTEGFSFIGIERDPESHQVSVMRLQQAEPKPDVLDMISEIEGA